MRAKGREQGRFVATSGFRKIAGPLGGRYELLIVDSSGRPVSPLCEWYRLRKQPGQQGTRRTYLVQADTKAFRVEQQRLTREQAER